MSAEKAQTMTRSHPVQTIALSLLFVVASVFAGYTIFHVGAAHGAPPAQLSPPTSTEPATLPPPKSIAAPAPTKPSDELSDPLTDPAGTYSDLKTAKAKGGWVLLVLGALVVALRLLSRLPGSIGAWLRKGYRGTIVAAAGAITVGAYDALWLGDSWAGVIIAAIGAALALWHPAPPTKEPPGLAKTVA